MSIHARRPTPTEEERHQVWSEWLEGHGVASIQRYDLPEHSVAAVRQILAEEPPEAIRADLRYRLGARFFWVSSSGLQNPLTGKADSLVVVRSPRAYTSKAFQTALRAVRRAVRSAGGEVDLGVIESVEADAAVRLVNERGYRCYGFDEAGAVESIHRIEVPDLDEAPAPSGP